VWYQERFSTEKREICFSRNDKSKRAKVREKREEKTRPPQGHPESKTLLTGIHNMLQNLKVVNARVADHEHPGSKLSVSPSCHLDCGHRTPKLHIGSSHQHQLSLGELTFIKQ